MVCAPVVWTREAFLRAAEGGAFEDRRVELIEGELIETVGENHPHRYATMAISEVLRAAFGAGFLVQRDAPIPMGRSQPKPDVVVLRGDLTTFRSREEGPDDAALIVEVVDSREDTAHGKRGLYARAEIPEYWILDVNRRVLTIHREPEAGEYGRVNTLREGDRARPLEARDDVLVADLLP